MPEKRVLGLDCRVYYNDVDQVPAGSGTIVAPNWVHLDLVKDATLQLTFEEADDTTRGSGGIKTAAASLLVLAVETKFVWRNGNIHCKTLFDNANARKPMDLLVLTGANTDADAVGYRGDFGLFGFTRNEELANVVMIDLKFIPVLSERSNQVAKAAGVAPP